MGINLLIPYMHYGLNGSICNVERKQYCGGEDREKIEVLFLKKGVLYDKKGPLYVHKGLLFSAKGPLFEQEGLLANIFPLLYRHFLISRRMLPKCARMCIVVLLTFYVSHLSHVSKSKNEVWTHGTDRTHVFGLTLLPCGGGVVLPSRDSTRIANQN